MSVVGVSSVSLCGMYAQMWAKISLFLLETTFLCKDDIKLPTHCHLFTSTHGWQGGSCLRLQKIHHGCHLAITGNFVSWEVTFFLLLFMRTIKPTNHDASIVPLQILQSSPIRYLYSCWRLSYFMTRGCKGPDTSPSLHKNTWMA